MSTTHHLLLVAVGGPGDHDAALRYATDQALRGNSGIRLVHVFSPTGVETGTGRAGRGFETAEFLAEELVRHAAHRIDSWAQGRVPVESLARAGSPVDVLLDLSCDAEAVVLQHHAPRRLVRAHPGSVVTEIARRSAVPVVSVPRHWGGRLTDGARVTVALHGGPWDDSLMDRAFETTRMLEGRLTVLHTWDQPGRYDAVTRSDTDRAWARHLQLDAVNRRVAKWRSTYPEMEVLVRNVDIQPVKALVHASETADLIIVGRIASPRGAPHLGADTRTLIREAACPVEVVPT